MTEKLEEATFEGKIEQLYNDITKEVFSHKSENKTISKSQIQGEIAKNKDRINNAQQMMLDGQITAEEYREIKKRYEPIIDKLLRDHIETDTLDIEFKRYLKKGLCLVKNLPNTYKNGNIKDKQVILRSILKENLQIENNEVRTGKLNETFSLFSRIDEAFRAKKKRTVSKNLELSSWVNPTDKISNHIIEDLQVLSNLKNYLTSV